jgi:hypothetical protein
MVIRDVRVLRIGQAEHMGVSQMRELSLENLDLVADGHFKFLHLWPGQNPPLDSVAMA